MKFKEQKVISAKGGGGVGGVVQDVEEVCGVAAWGSGIVPN